MAISVTKTIPSSAWYSGSGSKTITLAGVNNIVMNTKKSLIKTQILKGPGSWKASDTDKGDNQVLDLKKIEDTMKIRGWLIDTTSISAWEQAWQLRSMSASGGPVSSLIVDNLTFSSATQETYLEEVNFIAHPLRAQSLDIADTSSGSMNIARVEINLQFYFGDER